MTQDEQRAWRITIGCAVAATVVMVVSLVAGVKGRAKSSPGFANASNRLPRLCLVKTPKTVNHLGPKALALADPHGQDHAALSSLKRWNPGQTLTYTFRGGSQADRQELIDAANEWMQYANIKLVFTPTDPADVRIQIDDSGQSYAFVGRDILTVPADEPCMVIGWPDDPGRSKHEWGHVISLIHELQIPGNGIRWNLQALHDAYSIPPNSWSDQEIYQQILQPSSEPLANGSVFDRASIMCYPAPASQLLDASQEIPWNTELSPMDKKLIGTWLPYPATKQSARPLQLPTRDLQAGITRKRAA